MTVLHTLLTAPCPADPIESLDAWLLRHRRLTAGIEAPIDRALLGGLFADRLGYAFASAYHAALRALVPALGDEERAALCATERGGAHPRAIESVLEPDGAGYRLTGHKRWATLSPLADVLLVVARTGVDAAGRPVLRVARVPRARDGVALRPMPETPFAPEIPHAEVDFDRVGVSEDELLPGDGYDAYLKPFRTIEDLHVHAAVIGLVVGMARRHGWPHTFLEDALAAAALVRALAREPPSDPAVHVALAGAIRSAALLVGAISPLWREADADERARWERDAGLLAVASNARAGRALAAWRRLGGG